MTNRSICSVIDKEGNVTNYVWDDELKQLVVDNGGDVIDDNFRKITVEKQLDNICEILGGKVHHFTCCDRTTEHNKIVIEYNHKPKEK